jgi:hypothetical protein
MLLRPRRIRFPGGMVQLDANQRKSRPVHAYSARRRRRRSRKWVRYGQIGLGAVAGFAVAILISEAGFTPSGVAKPIRHDSFTLGGTLRLTGDSITIGNLPPGFNCAGNGRYGDIGPGTMVTVTDQSNAILAKGILDSSLEEVGACILSFAVDNVPGGSTFYQLEIAHRGSYRYTETEARQRIGMTMGGDAPELVPASAAPLPSPDPAQAGYPTTSPTVTTPPVV